VKRPILLAALALLVAASIVTLREPESLNKEASAQSFLEGVRVVNQRSGKLQWSFATDKAVISEDGATARMQAVTITIPGRGMTVEADSGAYDIDTRDVTLAGNVRARTEDYVIETGSVSLRTDEGVLFTDDTVVLEGKGFRIEGRGLRADQDQRVRLLGDVNAVFF
jgi:LPS export ABC transporter protein LptC